MPNDLERRLERALAPRREPGPEVEARLRAAALSALSPRRVPLRRRLSSLLRLRRRIGPLVLVAALLIGGAALAVTLLRWGPSSSGRVGAFVSEQAAERFAATPALAGAPWLTGGAPQRINEVPPRPSLVFQPGTSYPRALQAFYDAVSRRGELPPGTRLGPPLPAGKVVVLPTDPSQGLRLDLRAPFGYWVPSGIVLGPTYHLDPGPAVFPAADRPGTPLPVGVRVDAPHLLSCQLMRDARAAPSCRLSALPPGAQYAPGVALVPDLRGLRLPDALERLERDRLGLAFDVGYLPAWSEGAIARAKLDRSATESLITLAEFTRLGYGAPGLYRGHGRASVRLTPSESAPSGTVVAEYPPAGTEVPPGTPVVLAAASDDCLLNAFGGAAWDCVPGSAEAHRRVPALADPLPWLATKPSGAVYRLAEVPARPSLAFPPGTTYLQALRALLVAVVERGELPREARLGPALPLGVVVASPSARSRGLALDLRAPFGYDLATGQISGPSTQPLTGVPAGALRAAIRAGRAALLPPVFAGRYLELPRLVRCQMMRAGGPSPPCPPVRSPAR